MAWLRTALVAAAVVLGVASAYDRPETTKDFTSLDLDESGHVDRAEVDAHLDRQFDVRALCGHRSIRNATPVVVSNFATRVSPRASLLLVTAPCQAMRPARRRW
jgi:hypothetical protein